MNNTWNTALGVDDRMKLVALIVAVLVVGGSDVTNAAADRDLEVLDIHRFAPKQYRMLWDKAKAALGDIGKSDLPPAALVGGASTVALRKQFRTCCTQCAVSTKASAAYIALPKGANQAIRCNMALNENFNTKPPATRSVDMLKGMNLATSCNSLLSDEQQSKYKGRLFTFVRDPIRHFISGYKEIEYRNTADVAFQAQFTAKRGTAARVREFLWRYLNEEILHTNHSEWAELYAESNMPVRPWMYDTEMYHTYLQSGIRNNEQDIAPVVVGRVEALERNWLELQRWLGAERAYPFEQVCNHEETTKGDPQRAAGAAVEALDAEAELLRALCFLTLPDFINFGYDLPPVCVDEEMRATFSELGNVTARVLEVATQV